MNQRASDRPKPTRRTETKTSRRQTEIGKCEIQEHAVAASTDESKALIDTHIQAMDALEKRE